MPKKYQKYILYYFIAGFAWYLYSLYKARQITPTASATDPNRLIGIVLWPTQLISSVYHG